MDMKISLNSDKNSEQNSLRSIAIVTRTKNRTVLLERAIKSVLAQTYSDWTHVIVNDGGSKLAVDELVKKYTPEYADRLIVVHHPTSIGMEAASNTGIRATQSDYIVIHDDDDTWSPLFLEKMLTEFSEQSSIYPSIRGIICHSLLVKEEIRANTVEINEMYSFNDWIKSSIVRLERLALSNIFPPISFIFDRRAAETLGLFNEKLPVLGDWEFHLKFCLNFDIAILPEHLAYYHHRPSTKGIHGNSVHVAGDRHKVYREILINNWLRDDLKTQGLGTFIAQREYFEYILSNNGNYIKQKKKRKLRRFFDKILGRN